MTPTPGELDLTGTAVPAGLTLNYIIISPTKVLTGEPVTISIGMTNTRELEVSYSVPLKINGRVEATEEVTLASGASTTISFTVAKETAGTYVVEIGDLSSSFTVAKPPKASKPSAFSLRNLIVRPVEVTAGEPVTISIEAENTGEVESSYLLELNINGVLEATKEIALAGGASTTISFAVSKDTAGSYVVQIDGQNGEFTVLPPSLGISWSLVGGIIAVVVIGLAIVFFVTQRRRAPSS